MLLLRNTKQFQRVFEQVSLVIAIVLLKSLGSKPVKPRRAAMMLWA